MSNVLRSFRILLKAIRMTVTGNAIQTAEQRYPQLHSWVKQGVILINEVFQLADEVGMDEQDRKDYVLNIERRNMSMQVILATIKHNLTLEYPRLMEAQIEHNLTTLYALNMNDQYHISVLSEDLKQPEVLKQTLIKLSAHLNEIPSTHKL